MVSKLHEIQESANPNPLFLSPHPHPRAHACSFDIYPRAHAGCHVLTPTDPSTPTPSPSHARLLTNMLMPSTTYAHTHAIDISRTLSMCSLDIRAHALNAHVGCLALLQHALRLARTPSTHARIDSYHFSDGTVGSSTLEYAGIDTH